MNNKYSDYIYAKQYDKKRIVRFFPTDSGKEVALTDVFCAFLLKHGDHVSIQFPEKKENKYFELELSTQETRFAGKIPYQLLLTNQQLTIDPETGQIVWDDTAVIIGTITSTVLVEECVISDDDAATQAPETAIERLENIISEAGSYATEMRQAVVTATEAATSATTSEENAAQSAASSSQDATEIRNVLSRITFAEVATLLQSSWDVNDKTQTVTVEGVIASQADQLIVVRPSYGDQVEYARCDVLCIMQGTDSLTFQCEIVPTKDLTVYVMLQGLEWVDQDDISRSVVSDTAPAQLNTNDFWYQPYV